MEMMYAFTDESGSHGWNFNKPDVSTHFIICAIIVESTEVESLRIAVEKIRKKYFQTGEMKSSKVGKNYKRRMKILSELKDLNFTIFPVIIDKTACANMPGLRFKTSFYKFMNNIVYKELRNGFEKLTVVADEIGTSDYMKSFIKYIKTKEDVPNLFGEADFLFQNSKNDVLIQLADFMAGTLSFVFDKNKKNTEHPDYLKFLHKKTIRIMLYPKTYENYILDTSSITEDYDYEVANICFRRAALFMKTNAETEDKDVIIQKIILDYLLFRFMNNDKRGYIPTKELINQLKYTNGEKMSISTFRLKVICKLRDAGVIIASSSKGYKIPAKQSELYDFINHGVSVAIPVMERMKKCRDIVKFGTNGEIDLFDHTEYNSLRKFFDEEVENDDIN